MKIVIRIQEIIEICITVGVVLVKLMRFEP